MRFTHAGQTSQFLHAPCFLEIKLHLDKRLLELRRKNKGGLGVFRMMMKSNAKKLRQETRHFRMKERLHVQWPLIHQLKNAPENNFDFFLIQRVENRRLMDVKHGAKLREIMAVKSQPEQFPWVFFVREMGVGITPVNPDQLPGFDAKFTRFVADKSGSAQTKKHVLPQAGTPLNPIMGRGFKVSGSQHGIKKSLGLGSGRMKIRCQELRLRHVPQDSIIHVF
jgi:hypothetical protein